MSQIWKATRNALKKNLIAGMLVLLPIYAAVWILKVIVEWMDSFILSFLPDRIQPQTLYGRDIPGLGIVVTIVVVMLAGILTRLYIGKKIVQLGDYIFSKIPIGRSVYAVTKEFLTSIFSDEGQKFQSVAMVEWPRKGCHMMAFVTGQMTPLKGDTSQKWTTLFLPTSPNPTTGYFIALPEDEIIPLDISVDKAFKTIISSGVVAGNAEIKLKSK